MKYFTDNSIAPIIAIDFDGTICIGDGYPDPHNGSVRNYAKEVINLLYDVGVKIVIWTNRKNVPCTNLKDKLLMKQWLDEMGI
jgi:histidinol phosphatase-like enzyme